MSGGKRLVPESERIIPRGDAHRFVISVLKVKGSSDEGAEGAKAHCSADNNLSFWFFLHKILPERIGFILIIFGRDFFVL